MICRHAKVAGLLIDLECHLRNLNLWSDTQPSQAALSSEQPFCLDTLEFQQWLQFVFIRKINHIIEQEGQMPGKCAVAPYAEEYYRGQNLNVHALLTNLQAIDLAITADS